MLEKETVNPTAKIDKITKKYIHFFLAHTWGGGGTAKETKRAEVAVRGCGRKRTSTMASSPFSALLKQTALFSAQRQPTVERALPDEADTPPSHLTRQPTARLPAAWTRESLSSGAVSTSERASDEGTIVQADDGAEEDDDDDDPAEAGKARGLHSHAQRYGSSPSSALGGSGVRSGGHPEAAVGVRHLRGRHLPLVRLPRDSPGRRRMASAPPAALIPSATPRLHHGQPPRPAGEAHAEPCPGFVHVSVRPDVLQSHRPETCVGSM